MSRSKIDDWTGGTLRVVALIAGAVVAMIGLFLVVETAPALRSLGTRLLTDKGWYPGPAAKDGSFGMLPMIVGSSLVTLGAVALSAPIGLGSAIFCQYYAPRWIARSYRRLVELLAGIPSVVFGFWGLMVLAPLVAQLRPLGGSGHGLLTGTLIVALMILPTAMLVIEAALAAVPRSYLEGASALGMSRWSVIWHIAIPASRSGILVGVILSATRALGETMAVVMVCGNIAKLPQSVFDPVRTLTANIALEMGEAQADHRSALFVAGLCLLILALALIVAIRWIAGERQQHQVV